MCLGETSEVKQGAVTRPQPVGVLRGQEQLLVVRLVSAVSVVSVVSAVGVVSVKCSRCSKCSKCSRCSKCSAVRLGEAPAEDNLGGDRSCGVERHLGGQE